eukprot:5257792-Prymnesium_polylepis.1
MCIRDSSRALHARLTLCPAMCQGTLNKRLVLDVNFETSKDYDITSAYAVRGWNTTEGHMKITVPAQRAMHAGAPHAWLKSFSLARTH